MSRYKVTGHVTVSAYTLVEAGSEAEAIGIARGREAELAPNGPERMGIDPTEVVVIEDADGCLSKCRIEPMDAGDIRAWADRDEDDDDATE